jgi:tetratricopeptide (TPR) repeat protein
MPSTLPRPHRIGAVALAASLFAASLAMAPPAPAFANEAADKLVMDASRKLREQDVAGALRLLEQAIAVDPADPTANVLYQETARQVLGLADLKAKYQKLADENASDPLYLYLVTRLEEPEAALAAFAKMSKKHAKSPWPLIGKARALQLLDRDTDSIAALDAAVAIDSANPNIRAAQAFALETAGKFAEAADAWAQVAAARPSDRTAKIGQGEALRRAGQSEAALAAFQAAAKADAKDPDPPYRIGLVHLDAQKYDEATAAFDKALGLDRSMVEALIGASEAILKKAVANAKEGAKEIDEKALMNALAYSNRAVASNPESAAARFAQGAVYEALGELDADNLDTALDEYGEALDLLPFPGPERVRVLVARSFVLLRLASWDAAQSVAQQALDIDPNCVPAMIHAAHALCQVGKFEEAIKKHYKPGLKVTADDPRLLYGSGMAHWSLKKQNDARKLLEKASKADPGNGLYHLSLGELYYELKRYKEAVKELYKATDLRPKDPIAWTAYGRACTSEEHWEDAVEAFDKSIALNKEALDEFLWIAIIYDKHLDDREKAREYLEKWLEGDPEEDPNLESWIDDVFGDSEDEG